jgi:hypothetical protein
MAVPRAVEILRPQAVGVLAGEQRAGARAPQLREPLLSGARVHRTRREHGAGRAEQELVRRVVDVGGDRLCQRVLRRSRRREPVRDEQDPRGAHEQRGAGTRLVRRGERGLGQARGGRREVERGRVQPLAGEAPERMEHPRGARVQAA